MKDTNIREQSEHKIVEFFFIIAIIISIGALIFLLMIPSDPRNATFLGYSPIRLVTAGIFVFTAFLFLTLVYLSKKRPAMSIIYNALLVSKYSSIIAMLALLISLLCAFLTIHGISNINPAYTERIRPVILWVFLISADVLIFKYFHNPQSLSKPISDLRKMFVNLVNYFEGIITSLYVVFQKPLLNIVILLIISLPILLQNAIRYAFPVGVSGLYALMAESVQQNHFQLPFEIPYYGPGGIPFAYPPLAFYVMAFFTGPLRVNPLEYMRFAAPLFSLIALIPMYLLTKQITSSGIIASVATLFMATYARIYLIHGQAAGLARTLAFIFALTGLFFFYRAITIAAWRDTFLAGLFFGLSVLTHPTYAEFFAVGTIAFIFGSPSMQSTKFLNRIRQAAVVVLFGAIVASLWWLVVLLRYGSHLFTYASYSHDSLAFLSIFNNPSFIPTLIIDFMYKVNKTPLVAGPAMLGFFYLLVKKEWMIPLWFALYIYFFGGYDFLVIPITAIMAAIILYELSKLIFKPENTDRTYPLAASLFILFFISLGYSNGYKSISKYQPELSDETFELSEWFKNNTPDDITFLRVSGSSEEPEWYPYLLRRSPVLASWGSEWTGDYKRQYGAVRQIAECGLNQSLTCIQAIINDLNAQPHYMIIDTNQQQLENELSGSHAWVLVYQNPRYEVWALRELVNPD